MHLITIVTASLDIGGTETHLATLLPELASKGFAFDVICLHPPKDLSLVKQLSPHVNLITIPRIRQPLTTIHILYQLYRYFKQSKATITHFFMPKAYLLGAIAHRIAQTKNKIIMSRRCQNDYQKKYPLLAKIEHALHQQTSLILTNSQQLCDELIQEEKVHSGKTLCIHNGLSCPSKEAPNLRQMLNLPKEAFVIMKVANFIPYKGHKDLLEAFAQLPLHNCPSPTVLCLFGENRNNYLDRLKVISEQLGITEHVRWIEKNANAKSFWHQADIAVHCAHEEGLPNAILEAMACQKPIVATHIGGIPELIQDEKNGLLVRPHSPEQLSKTIERLIQSLPLRMSLAKKSYQTWQQSFTLDQCIEKTINAYQKLIEG